MNNSIDFCHGSEIEKFNVNFNRVFILIRGVSGSGKTTLKDYLKYIHTFGNPNSTVVDCESDDFMHEGEEYKFNPKKLGYTHNACREKFRSAVENHTNLVIVSNTSTRDGDVKIYLDIAKKYGYTCFVMVMENRNNTKNIHFVPQETLERQEQQLNSSMKFR